MQCEGRWNRGLLSAGFNQDASHAALGTPRGVVVVGAASGERVFASAAPGPVAVCEMYFSSALLAVSGHARREPASGSSSSSSSSGDVVVVDDDESAPATRAAVGPRTVAMLKGSEVLAELNFVTRVLGVRLGARRMAVVLETHIHVFDIKGLAMARLHCLDTPPNPRGLCALASAGEGALLAYPAQAGHVALFDALRVVPLGVVRAHNSAVAAIALSRDGALLATASAKGTVIRVFCVATGAKLCSFRRGRSAADVFSLAFSPDARVLAASSDTGTVHVFHVPPQQQQAATSSSSSAAAAAATAEDTVLVTSPVMAPSTNPLVPLPLTSTSSGGSTASHYSFWQLTPSVAEALFENVRSFASAKLPSLLTAPGPDGVVHHPPSVLAIDGESRLLAITADGFLHQYTLGNSDLRHVRTRPLVE